MVKTEVVEFVRNESSTLIVVEHDVSRAKSIADRMLVIDDLQGEPIHISDYCLVRRSESMRINTGH